MKTFAQGIFTQRNLLHGLIWLAYFYLYIALNTVHDESIRILLSKINNIKPD